MIIEDYFLGIQKNINFDFETFRYNLLTLNHIKPFCSSYVIEFSISSVFYPNYENYDDTSGRKLSK